MDFSSLTNKYFLTDRNSKVFLGMDVSLLNFADSSIKIGFPVDEMGSSEKNSHMTGLHSEHNTTTVVIILV